MGFKIVHLADLHLDLPFRDLGRNPTVATARREGLREALKRAFDLGRSKQVDAITIGGDLFGAEDITADTVQFLRQQFERAAPMRVFIAPGNHDPYTRGSPYAYADWSDNVHIFKEPRLTPAQLADDLQIWGAAHDSPAFYQPLLTDFHLPDQKPALLLLHGTEQSITLGQDQNAFCPFNVQEVRKSGFGLALLGHVHHQRALPDVNPLIFYPGSPEPLGFDEERGHSVIVAEWNGAHWNISIEDISQWMVRAAEVDISGVDSRDQVVEWITRLWSDERLGKKLVAKVILTGQPAQSLDLDQDAIAVNLQSIFNDLVLQDRTLPPFDLNALKTELTTTGEFVRRILTEMEAAKRAEDEPKLDLLEKAMRFGLLALDSREIPNP